MKLRLAASCALAAALALPASGALAQNVGSVGAVNQSATGAKPGASAAPLTLGAPVVQKERIQTGADGTAQIAFIDRSSLNVGRNSSITIDRFVFDGSSDTGQTSVNLARGALRFVGGQISHTEGATVKTPAATVGIRGGIVTIVVERDGSLRVLSGFGLVTVQNAAGYQEILMPGFEIFVAGPNTPPGPPSPVDPATLARLMALFSSAPNQTGGATTTPNDTQAAQFGVGSPRGDAQTPNPDLPAVLNQLIRGYSNSQNQTPPPTPGNPNTGGGGPCTGPSC